MRNFSVFLIIPMQTGNYFYVESSGTTRGQRAEFVTPCLSGRPSGRCLKFYYFMYGKRMGSMVVKLTLSDGRNWYIFYKKGDQDQYWKKGIGNIDPAKKNAHFGQTNYKIRYNIVCIRFGT